MKIEANKRYMMRYGGITGVMQRNTVVASGWFDGALGWYGDGRYFGSGADHNWDLVAEYTQPAPLPFTLKAGEKYDTDTGEVVTLTGGRFSGHACTSMFPFACDVGGKPFYVTRYGHGMIAVSGDKEFRIVSVHHEPTPIERLEHVATSLTAAATAAIAKGQFDWTQSVAADLLAIIADLKRPVVRRDT